MYTLASANDGKCKCVIGNSPRIPKNVGQMTFSVDDVTAASGQTYDALANHDPDGDGDGSVIVVAKP